MRIIISIFVLLLSFQSHSQVAMFHAHNTGIYYGLILDDNPGAKVALSFRKESSSYSSNIVEVRRSSDNTTQNIGFSGNYLDTAALKTFVGASNGYVRTWYDQSGNGNNATQTTNSLQPMIVNAGSVVYDDGWVAMQFDGTDDYLTGSWTVSQPATYFLVAKSDRTANKHFIDGGGGNRQILGWLAGPKFVLFAGTVLDISSSPTPPNTSALFYAIFQGTSSTYGYNTYSPGTLGNAGTGTLSSPLIGQGQGGTTINGTISELIIYEANKTSQLTNLRGNINNHYTIYTP